MNVVLWILQILLALWNIIGGAYTFTNYDKLKGPMAADLPQPVWMILAALQILFAIGLVLPASLGMQSNLTSTATYLALNALAGCLLFSQYAGFPGVLWGLIPAVISALVAYGRWA